jgi:hypothetical protein
MTKRALVCGLPRPLEPTLRVLTGVRVRRSQQRRDPKSAGRARLQVGEELPAAVVERSFDVAGDDCVPFVLRVRHLRIPSTLRRG